MNVFYDIFFQRVQNVSKCEKLSILCIILTNQRTYKQKNVICMTLEEKISILLIKIFLIYKYLELRITTNKNKFNFFINR